MDRRELLAGVASGVLAGASGCGSVITMPSRADRTRISTAAAPLGTDAAAASVEVVQHFTSEHPAKVAVSLRNVTETQVWVGPITMEGPVSSLVGEQVIGDARLYLFGASQAADAVPDDPAFGTCWRPTRGPITQLRNVNARLDPGQVVSGTYTLTGTRRHPADKGPCLVPGTYRFQSRFEVDAPDSTDEVDLQFSIRIAN